MRRAAAFLAFLALSLEPAAALAQAESNLGELVVTASRRDARMP